VETRSTKFRTPDGVDIHYVVQGQGPCVTLIHGIGADHANWDGVVPLLTPHFTVMRADLRGHGGSSRIERCSLDDFVADVEALLQHEGVVRSHVVGFSLGGLIGQKYAINQPERLDRLVLISSVAERTAEERVRVSKRADQIDREGITSVMGQAQERWFTPEFLARNPEIVQARLKQLAENDHRSYAAAYRVFALADEGLEYERIQAPTLVMTGEFDSGSSPRMAHVLHDRIAGSELEILPRLRHSVLLEAPQLIGDRVLRFLRRS
jgi:pimeloyl-ACP methyl ester carboxylesterase